jgi:hypothetical protein
MRVSVVPCTWCAIRNSHTASGVSRHPNHSASTTWPSPSATNAVSTRLTPATCSSRIATAGLVVERLALIDGCLDPGAQLRVVQELK